MTFENSRFFLGNHIRSHLIASEMSLELDHKITTLQKMNKHFNSKKLKMYFRNLLFFFCFTVVPYNIF